MGYMLTKEGEKYAKEGLPEVKLARMFKGMRPRMARPMARPTARHRSARKCSKSAAWRLA